MENESIEGEYTKTKEVELNVGEDIYKCDIQIINNILQISIHNKNLSKIRGDISSSKLNNNKLNLIKDDNRLKIEFTVLDKKVYLNMELNENINNSDYIKTIKESKEIIKKKKIKLIY